MRLHEAMQELEILVEFRARTDATRVNSRWCADIELFVDYGTEFESLQGKSPDIFLGGDDMIVCRKQKDLAEPTSTLTSTASTRSRGERDS